MVRTIVSLQHPLVKHLIKLRQNRDYRYEHHTLLIEGLKPVQEVCEHLRPKLLLAVDESFIPPRCKDVECVIVSESVMQKISGMVHPEGLMAEVPMPVATSFDKIHRLLVLDNIADPGNLGTLLRTALALGWQGAFIVGESCDPYNEKALRAARGATFRLPLRQGPWTELQQLARNNELVPFVADLQGTPLQKVDKALRPLLVLGNEAHGVSNEAKAFCRQISIPLCGNMESLNVAAAGAILMYILSGDHV